MPDELTEEGLWGQSVWASFVFIDIAKLSSKELYKLFSTKNIWECLFLTPLISFIFYIKPIIYLDLF